MKKVVFILGPTGSGKSDIAIKLALKYNGEIISSDSVQIYRGFDIGSAKISEKEMCGVIHHAIDICPPEQYFSVFDFVELSRKKIDEICSRGHLPIVVGGTGLYIKALIEGYNFGNADKHDDFRQKLEELAQKNGKEYLYEMLKSKSPEMAEKIDKNNVKRVIRALEIAEFGGNQTSSGRNYDSLIIALNLDREKLYSKINKRVDIMVQNGLIEEVQGLLKKNISKNCQPMQAIGYKEVVEFLDGNCSKEEAINLVKQHTRNYAKRQLTFLRGMKNVNWVDGEDKGKALEETGALISKFLKEKNYEG